MRVLCLSDKVVSFISGPQVRHVLGEIDLILGCGDLPPNYIETVVSFLNVPAFFVPGNHDADSIRVQGAVSADGSLVNMNGVRVLGFGGSRRYKKKGRHQYTEAQMRRRILQSVPAWITRRILRGSGLDILLTHSPPWGIHDTSDLAHRGFRSFLTLMDWARPRLMVHGHVHAIPNIERTETRYHSTKVINVYPYRVIELTEGGIEVA